MSLKGDLPAPAGRTHQLGKGWCTMFKDKSWKCSECGTENDRSTKTCMNCGAEMSERPVSKYKAIRRTTKAISIVGWFIVVLSIYGLLHLGLTMRSLFLILGGFFSGFILVIAGYVARAATDIADNTGQILALVKRKNTERVAPQ
jgi:uncharacterized membrane protein YvbJ